MKTLIWLIFGILILATAATAQEEKPLPELGWEELEPILLPGWKESWWANCPADSCIGPLPPADNIVGGIMGHVFRCGEDLMRDETYNCPLKVRGGEEEFFPVEYHEISVRPVGKLRYPRQPRVDCDKLRMWYDVATFQQKLETRCRVLGVIYEIKFGMVVTDKT